MCVGYTVQQPVVFAVSVNALAPFLASKSKSPAEHPSCSMWPRTRLHSCRNPSSTLRQGAAFLCDAAPLSSSLVRHDAKGRDMVIQHLAFWTATTSSFVRLALK